MRGGPLLLSVEVDGFAAVRPHEPAHDLSITCPASRSRDLEQLLDPNVVPRHDVDGPKRGAG